MRSIWPLGSFFGVKIIFDRIAVLILLDLWVRLWSEASYLLAAEAQRKDWLMEVVSEDVFTYNDQVVKQLAMISE